MNSFDIIYSGILRYLIIIFRTNKYFKNIPHVKRKNVLSFNELDYSIHIKKHIIHVSFYRKHDYSKQVIENYLSSVFFDINIGIHNFENSTLDFNDLDFIKI